jgi:hypothetical protein
MNARGVQLPRFRLQHPLKGCLIHVLTYHIHWVVANLMAVGMCKIRKRDPRGVRSLVPSQTQAIVALATTAFLRRINLSRFGSLRAHWYFRTDFQLNFY